jgi:antitoxin (DNA-binding transcriptional repressor) of toxin-antitoxin stability system
MNAKPQHKGSEEARSQLPALLSDAERGRSTVISRRGRAVAVLVPIGHAAVARARPLLPLAGSGRGLWAAGGPAAIATQRDEWSR